MNVSLPVNERRLRDRVSFAALLREVGGLMEEVSSLAQEPATPAFAVAVTSLDNLTMTWAHVAPPFGTDARDESIGGAGADPDAEQAWIRAVSEGAERYCCMVYHDRDFITASASELGSAALDLRTLPHCSRREYADPDCPLRPPDSRQPIRWVRGFSLIDRRERLVPAIMTHLYLRALPAERFWQPITTGVAAHTSLATALNAAICEQIERDAIALTWLARLSLPCIEIEEPVAAVLAPNYARLRKSLVRQYFFDATTDVGVPTVYAVQLLDGHPTLGQYVNCATDFDAAAACAKTIREAAPARAVFQMPREIPEDVNQFGSLYDGAVYMGRPEQRHGFDFLLRPTSIKPLSAVRVDAPDGDAPRMRFLLERLAAVGTDAIAVDLTTEEVRDAGLWVVRVVTPGLQPMSTIHRARFLGHRRLYEYPRRAGFGRLTEQAVNAAPQPFA